MTSVMVQMEPMNQNLVAEEAHTHNVENHIAIEEVKTQVGIQEAQMQLDTQEAQMQLVSQASQMQLVTHETQMPLVTQETQMDLVSQETQMQMIIEEAQTQLVTKEAQTQLLTKEAQTQFIAKEEMFSVDAQKHLVKAQIKLVAKPDQTQRVTEPDQSQAVIESDHTQMVIEPDQTQRVSEPDQALLVTEPGQMQLVPIPDQVQMVAEPDQMQLATAVEKSGLTSTNVTQYFTTDQVFDSRPHIIQWCQEVGRQITTVVVILKSEKPVPGRKGRLLLGCERGGVFRDHKKKSDKRRERNRETATKKCGCPFLLRGVPLPDDKWKLKVHCGEHNHEIAKPMVGHSYAGRLSNEEKQILLDMTKSGVKPKDVLSTIKQRNKDNMSTMRTIYNARANMKLRNVEGRSALQQVMKLLLEHHYLEWHRTDEETKEVRDIVWAHPESIQLAKCFNSMLMFDCTFKNNRYRMPLFEILGVTSTGKLFTVASGFMEAETEEHYVWALSQLKTIYDPNSLPAVFVTEMEMPLISAINSVFPQSSHMLCMFHITSDIVTTCKKHFETSKEFERFFEEWTNVIKSKSQIEFLDRLAAFEISWASYSTCLQHLRDTWLPHKEHFVYAWTNLMRHFGNRATNRAESALSKLKNQLGSSQGTLTSCWTAMHNMIIGEIIDVKASFEKSLTTVPDSHNLLIFKELRRYVSHLALDFLVLENSRSHDIGMDAATCGCVLRHTHGLPCAHEIAQFVRDGHPLPLSEIDPHWKKLSAVPTPNVHSDLDYHPEMHLLKKKWEDSSEDERQHILKKIKDIAMDTTCDPSYGTPRSE